MVGRLDRPTARENYQRLLYNYITWLMVVGCDHGWPAKPFNSARKATALALVQCIAEKQFAAEV